MGKLKTRSKAKIVRYIPILLILLSITIMIGSTFAYFTDRVDESSSLTFSKVELSGETTVGIDGKIGDALPGTPLVDSPISFSKAIDSEAIYVRAKISFSLPDELKNDDEMVVFLATLKGLTDFGIITTEQNNAVWSQKKGDYFYLLDSNSTDNLKRVDTIDTYLLTESIVIPRGLEQLEDNYQYMKSINFHIAFEAIQADNVSATIEESEKIFDAIFPTIKSTDEPVIVTILDYDFNILDVEVVDESGKINEPAIKLPTDKDGTTTKLFLGWYVDKDLTVPFDFDSKVESNISLYPKALDASDGLEFTELSEEIVQSSSDFTSSSAPDFTVRNQSGSNVTSYSVAIGTCTDSNIIVPTLYKGLPVTQVTANGFDGCENLQSITLPNTVHTFNDYAFRNCVNLEEIPQPDSLKIIGSNSFSGCVKITDAVINEGVTNIKDGAFSNCTGIDNLVLPTTLTEIGGQAFNNCMGLETITIPENVTSMGYLAFNNCENISTIYFNATNVSNNSSYPAFNAIGFNTEGVNIYIGANVRSIRKYLFANYANYESYQSNFTSVIFEEGSVCETIGQNAFYNIQALKQIKLSDSITSIGQYAFYGCYNLENINIPENLTSLGNRAFYSCQNVKVIDYNAKNLKNTVKEIFFFGYVGKTSGGATLNIGEKVESLPSYLFYPYYYQDYYYANIEKVVFKGDNIINIGVDTFYGCSYIKEVAITNIESWMQFTFASSTSNPVTYSKKLYLNGELVTDVVVPNYITTLNSYVFYRCSTLRSITIGENVDYIGTYAFYECDLVNIIIPNSVTIIDKSAFYNCYHLETITLGTSLTSIGSDAFYNCNKLVEVTNLSNLDLVKGDTSYGYAACYAFDLYNTITESKLKVDSNGFKFYDGGEGNTYLISYTGTDKNLVLPTSYNGNSYSVYKNAFRNNSFIETVEISNGITSVYSYAFSSCSRLYKVIVGSDVVDISSYAFYSCSKLHSVTIGESVTSIGSNAFNECGLLVEVVNKSVLEIVKGESTHGKVAYYALVVQTINSQLGVNSEDFVFVDNGDDGVYLLSYKGNETNLVLPSSYNGKSYAIYKNAFINLDIESVVIPNGVTAVGERAFYNCRKLKTLTIGEDVKSLGIYAFYNCVALTEINFYAINMSNLTYMYNYTFYSAGQGGAGITVNIGPKVERIPGYIFFPINNTDYIVKIKEVIFDENSVCTEIGPVAFWYCTSLKSIAFPNSLTTIASEAFYSCGLNTVYLNDNLKTLNSNAFYYCDNIKKLYVSSLEVWLSFSYNLLKSGGDLYINNELLTSLVIPNTVTGIRNVAFMNCSSLTSVVIPESVTSIGNSAFYGCIGLTSVTIPESVTSIGTSVFFGCSQLSEVVLPSNMTSIPASMFYNCISLIDFNMPEGITSIGGSAFYGCTGITSIEIGERITSIGGSAFYGCTYVTEIMYNATAVEDLTSNSNVFYNVGSKVNGVTLTIGANVTKIPAYLFYASNSSYYPNLNNVIFEDGSVCENIGMYAFAGAVKIQAINIPDTVKLIGDYAFNNCTNLSNLILSENLEIIGTYAFNKCANITKILIPMGVTSIGDNAFNNCTKLLEVTNLSDLDIVKGATTHGYVAYYALIVYDAISESKIITDDDGYKFFVNGEDDTHLIGYEGSDTELVLPENCNGYNYSIYKKAFYNNTNIVKITMSNGVNAIGEYAFYGCSRLNTVNMGNGVTSIGQYAFYNCTYLKTLTMSSNLEQIGNNCFYGCERLTSITIPEKVTSIGYSAFYNCRAVSEIKFNAINMSNLHSGNGLFRAGGFDSGGIYVTIGAKVKNVPSSLFYSEDLNNCRIKNVVFAPGSVCESIGDYAFMGIGNHNLELPSTITSIGAYAFQRSALRSITLPNGITSISNGLFYYCSSLNEVVLPKGIITIGSQAFQECKSLKAITIGKEVTSIGNQAFYYCEQLIEVTNLSSLDIVLGETTHGYVACYAIAIYTTETESKVIIDSDGYKFYDGGEGNTYLIGYEGTEKDLVLPDSCNGKVYDIYDKAFYKQSLSSENALNSITFSEGVRNIGYWSFANCGIKSVTFSNSIENVDEYAFYILSGLNEINIPSIESWMKIKFTGNNSNPLQYAKNLYIDGELVTEIEIPDSITSIDNYTFAYCEGIQKITIPSSITSIGDYAFAYCNNLIYAELADGVTSIGKYAFYECEKLNSINIPSTVTSIGSYAFAYCYYLTIVNYNAKNVTDLTSSANVFYYAGYNGDGITLTIDKDVEHLPAYLFYYSSINYSNIIKCEFKDGIVDVSIGAYAFYNNKIRTLILSKGITSIGNYAFYGCSYLTKIDYNAKNVTDLTSSNYVFYSAGRSANGIEVTIGASVEKIPAYLFYPYSNYLPNITSIVFEEGSACTSIGAYAFYGCSSILEITIPENVISIGDYAFKECLALIAVTNLSSLDIVIGETSNGYVAYYALEIFTEAAESRFITDEEGYVFFNGENNKSLVKYIGNDTELVFPEDFNGSQYSILAKAFYGNTNIKSVTLSDGVTSIGAYAFYNCRYITELTIPESVTSIGNYAFYGCYELEKINYNAILISDVSSNNNIFTSVGAYSDGISLNVGENVTRIPAYMFYPESNGYAYIEKVIFAENSKCESIGDNAFYNNKYLEELTIPESVTTIGNRAFYGCVKMTSIQYDAINVTDLTTITFEKLGNSSNGVVVTIGPNVQKIPACLFYTNGNDAKVTSVIFANDGVCSVIGSKAFYNCSYLPSISIPNTITNIDENAFGGCSNLLEVTNLSDLDIKVGESTHGKVAYYALAVYSTETESKIVTEGNYTYYAGGEGNTYLIEYIGSETEVVLPDNLNGFEYNIFNYAFYKNTTITSVTLPNCVTSIGMYAFSGCNKLVNINTSNITYLGEGAFQSCSLITSIDLMEGVTSIGNSTFSGCNALISVNIPNTVTSIGNHAFAYCYNLTEVEIPDAVTSIGDYAFYNCSKLTSITIPELVTYVGSNAFYCCNYVTEINYYAKTMQDLAKNNYVFFNVGKNGEGVTLTIGANVEYIPAYMFSPYSGNYPYITNIEFVERSVGLTIGDYSFMYCRKLISLVLPDVPVNIGVQVFYYCTGLINVETGAGETVIGKKAFSNCTALQSLTLGEGLTSLANAAFYECTALIEIKFNAISLTGFTYSSNEVFYKAGQSGSGIVVTIGAKVQKIPSYIFAPSSYTSYRPKIVQVIFEENSVCTTIENYAFEYCDALKSVELPSSITSMGNYPFSRANNPYILCDTLAVARLANGKGSTNIYVVDTTTDFSSITFAEVASGSVNGTYNDGTNYYVRTGEEGSYVYYKKYTA